MIDIGVNLADSSFDKDREEVLARAKAAGIDSMIITGTSVRQSKKALELANEYGLFSTAGIHPHDASSFDARSMPELRALCQNDRVVALGECGLDFFRDVSPRKQQIEVFVKILELAVDVNLPIFLHERNALDETITILNDFKTSLPKTVIHCFTGDKDALKKYLDLGLYVGVTGWVCDERRGSDLQQCINLIPDNRLMVETDAPYLLPRTIRPKPKTRRNEPKHLVHVAQKCAELRQQSLETLQIKTNQTTKEFFGLQVPHHPTTLKKAL